MAIYVIGDKLEDVACTTFNRNIGVKHEDVDVLAVTSSGHAEGPLPDSAALRSIPVMPSTPIIRSSPAILKHR